MQVNTFRIPGWGRVQIPADSTVALVSGEVPRLVVRDGSDSFDLWEGQSLPLTGRGRSAYLYNPFQRDVVVYIAFGLPVNLAANTSDFRGRHYEKTAWLVPFNSVPPTVGVRIGVGILPLRGKIEVTCAAETPGRVRLSVITGADPAFLALKPANVMTTAVYVRGPDSTYSDQCLTMFGTYSEADAQAWVAAAGGETALAHYHVTSETARVIARPDAAVFLSRDFNVAFEGHLSLREIGLGAEDFD